jgi:hypothetical protein
MGLLQKIQNANLINSMMVKTLRGHGIATPTQANGLATHPNMLIYPGFVAMVLQQV